MKKIDNGVYSIMDITIHRIDEYNEHDTLVIRWELQKAGEWIEMDSFETLREARGYVMQKWHTL